MQVQTAFTMLFDIAVYPRLHDMYHVKSQVFRPSGVELLLSYTPELHQCTL